MNTKNMSLSKKGSLGLYNLTNAVKRHQAVIRDVAFSIRVGMAAEYKSACVNTLRRSLDGCKHPSYQRIGSGGFCFKRGFMWETIQFLLAILIALWFVLGLLYALYKKIKEVGAIESFKNFAGGIVVLIILLFLIGTGYEIWNQTCLGVFSDKRECEVQRDFQTDLRFCREQSLETCKILIEDNETFGGDKYEQCLDKTRCKCMSSNNHKCE